MVEGEIHIGRIIQAKLKEQGRSVVWLAKQIPCTREHLYKIFAKPDINTAMLQRISKILDYNFFKLYE
ncbi:MAG: XRE family transcriptional regulator [Bacteroidales bacterium]|nr:XRE family transcriptional regulator [Bacteroidales bacterium]